MPSREATTHVLEKFDRLELVNSCERKRAERLFDEDFAFSDVIQRAESLHVHVKVDDVAQLPLREITAAGGSIDYQKEGFAKFRFGGGVNMIFSSIPVSQDDLIETDSDRRARPFVDHFGIDLRDESAPARDAFERIPLAAQQHGWSHIAQGESGGGVHCCHVEVEAKHWAFPNPGGDAPLIPLEFAFGALVVNDVSGGCDLRPMDPHKSASLEGPMPFCAG